MSPLPEGLLEDFAASAVRQGLADAVFASVPTPIGRLTVVQGPRGVVRVGFEETPEDEVLAQVAAHLGPRILRSERELSATREALEAYFDGDGELTGIPYDLSLVRSPFRREVLEALHDDVPRGRTVRYGELAARAGRPRAARAVGTACATNPVPIVIPCHRVLPSTGRVGSYGGGPPRKARLLELEGALPSRP